MRQTVNRQHNTDMAMLTLFHDVESPDKFNGCVSCILRMSLTVPAAFERKKMAVAPDYFGASTDEENARSNHQCIPLRN